MKTAKKNKNGQVSYRVYQVVKNSLLLVNWRRGISSPELSVTFVSPFRLTDKEVTLQLYVNTNSSHKSFSTTSSILGI
jgi:hypothetical protein